MFTALKPTNDEPPLEFLATILLEFAQLVESKVIVIDLFAV